MRRTNCGLVIHAHWAIGLSRIPSGSTIGGFSTPDFSISGRRVALKLALRLEPRSMGFV